MRLLLKILLLILKNKNLFIICVFTDCKVTPVGMVRVQLSMLQICSAILPEFHLRSNISFEQQIICFQKPAQPLLFLLPMDYLVSEFSLQFSFNQDVAGPFFSAWLYTFFKIMFIQSTSPFVSSDGYLSTNLSRRRFGKLCKHM